MIESTENKVVFVVGSEKVYPFPIRFFDKSEIKCYVKSGTTDRELIPGEYMVEDKEDYSEGANITLIAPFAPGVKLVIMRECPISQKVSFPLNGKFSSKSNENALDKLTMICQQLKEEIARCVKIAATDGQKPEDIIAMLLGAKDMALTAAESAADANASTAAAALTVHTIWSEITGNDASAQEALEALKQAFEAAGSVEAAAAAGRESVNAASLAAVEYAQGQIEESKNASVEVLSATTKNRREELLALISDATGAEGAVQAAVNAANAAAEEAKESAGSIEAATSEALASVKAAAGVAEEKKNEALAAANNAKIQAEQAGDSAAEAYSYIAETLANKEASAASAQDAAESAAAAQISANAAASAAGDAAQSVVNTSLTAHNAAADAHNDKFNLYLPLSGGTMSGGIMGVGYLELYGGGSHGGYIDFHFAGDPSVDYTARIMEDGYKILSIYAANGVRVNQRHVVRSVDGVLADAAGNVALTTTGTVIAMAGNITPSGYLLCAGAAVSRTTYAGLFAAIGTTYGTGDGSTTFNLPDLTDKFIQGSGTAGTVKVAGLPNIEGKFDAINEGNSSFYFADTQGAFGPAEYGNASHSKLSANAADRGIGIDASRSNPIYGNSDTVQPPALTMRFCIKY